MILGARLPLIAFNVNLRGSLAAAREVAAVVREKGGGFPGVRALGLDLPRAGLVQVSMNVEDWEAAALHEIVARIAAEAEARGAEVVGSELVGLMPAGAAAAAAGAMLRIDGFDAVARARAAAARRVATRAPPSPTSGTAIAAAPNTARAATNAKSGETNSSPVACAPRWVNEITPSTRPSRWSGTSSCAAELSSTTDVLWPSRREERAGDRERQRVASAISP